MLWTLEGPPGWREPGPRTVMASEAGEDGKKAERDFQVPSGKSSQRLGFLITGLLMPFECLMVRRVAEVYQLFCSLRRGPGPEWFWIAEPISCLQSISQLFSHFSRWPLTHISLLLSLTSTS
jgi:hypothetical protein